VGLFAYFSLFGAPQSKAEPERFIVSQNAKTQDTIKKLHDQGFVKSEWALGYTLKGNDIQPGGYKISKSMTAWEMAKALTQEPYMKWVVIPEGLRKEQIADLIAEELGWTDQQKAEWINKYTAMKYDETEGVYFPDTYLLPKDETGLQIADRLRTKFNEKFQPYADKFVKENVKWTTALKVASLVQREAANKADMPLIAGIIWNRLLNDPPMKLEIDATVQYALGESGNWWPKIKPTDYKTDSAYNTYLHTGLPPHPICNPGLDAISATLNPTETDCLYYLHDSSGQTHCAKTYEEHKLNIEKYLK
jgi:UPF0755 protein